MMLNLPEEPNPRVAMYDGVAMMLGELLLRHSSDSVVNRRIWGIVEEVVPVIEILKDIPGEPLCISPDLEATRIRMLVENEVLLRFAKIIELDPEARSALGRACEIILL